MKRYRLNESVDIRNLFRLNKARLNEGKTGKVTISDIQAAFNEAAGMYGSMTDEEAMAKCKKDAPK